MVVKNRVKIIVNLIKKINCVKHINVVKQIKENLKQ